MVQVCSPLFSWRRRARWSGAGSGSTRQQQATTRSLVRADTRRSVGRDRYLHRTLMDRRGDIFHGRTTGYRIIVVWGRRNETASSLSARMREESAPTAMEGKQLTGKIEDLHSDGNETQVTRRGSSRNPLTKCHATPHCPRGRDTCPNETSSEIPLVTYYLSRFTSLEPLTCSDRDCHRNSLTICC